MHNEVKQLSNTRWTLKKVNENMIMTVFVNCSFTEYLIFLHALSVTRFFARKSDAALDLNTYVPNKYQEWSRYSIIAETKLKP